MAGGPAQVETVVVAVVVVAVIDDCWGYPGEGPSRKMEEERERLALVVAHFRPHAKMRLPMRLRSRGLAEYLQSALA